MNARPRRRATASAIGVLALGLVLTACGSADEPQSQGESETTPTTGETATQAAESEAPTPTETDSDALAEIVEAANAEGTLSVYTSLAIGYEGVFAAFNEVYPEIEVEPFIGKDVDLLARVEQEAATNTAGADVLWVSTSQFFASAEDGMFADLTDLPSAELWSASENFHGSYLQPLFYPAVVAWNSDRVVEDPPSDYPDLLDPRYAGKIGTVDPTLTPNIVAFFQFLQEEHGEDFLERLGEQRMRFYDSGPSLEAAMASGEIDVAAYNSLLGALNSISKGAPIDYVEAPVAPVTNQSAGALTSGNSPNAALVFMDWVMSEEGQAAMVESGNGAFISPLDDSASIFPLKPELLAPDEWPDIAAEQRRQLSGE